MSDSTDHSNSNSAEDSDPSSDRVADSSIVRAVQHILETEAEATSGTAHPTEHPAPTEADANPIVTEIGAPSESVEHRLQEKVKALLVGKPRDLADQAVFQHVSLVAFLAWVGLGADGLSSSCYGPAEAFVTLGQHRFLAVFLSLATITTVLVISACYRHIIEEFPSGGGGYLVASKLLGPRVGVVSGCALLVDYVLTITTSIAAAGDALFGMLPTSAFGLKLYAEIGAIILLIVMNLRGVKESVKVLLPIFLIFLATHIVLILGSVCLHLTAGSEVIADVAREVQNNLDGGLGLFGMVALLLRAYTLGAGTYTGIEAVSNSMPVMREPRVATAKRTMLYMAMSLAIAAGGLMVAYLLLDVRADPDSEKTMNHVLTETFVSDLGFTGWGGETFVWITLFSEATLLFVAAQAGFIDGPRVLANMAHDSWMPHWFSNLSERLATHNGIILMGITALGALVITKGSVPELLVMYAINVFLTFSLSMVGMLRHWWEMRGANPLWKRRFALFLLGATMCISILLVTIYEKGAEGGWITLVVTGCLILLCLATHRHYDTVISKLRRLDQTLTNLPAAPEATTVNVEPSQPTAAILVGGYSGLGVHTLLNAVRFAPGHFKNMVFISVAVVDSGNFKGAPAVEDLRGHTQDALDQYVSLARRLGMPATSFMTVGTDPVDELEQLCLVIARQFPKVVFFAGQLLFEQDTWYHRMLHNQTAFSLQRRLQWVGLPMVILPTRVR